MSTDKITRQMALEEEAVGLGVSRYRKLVQRAKERGTESDLPAVVRLMDRILKPTSSAISAWCKAKAKNARRSGAMLSTVSAWDSDQLAYITAKVVLNGVTTQRRLQTVALDIVSIMEDELSYTKLSENAPGLYRLLLRQTARSTSYRHRRAVMQHASNKLGHHWEKPWNVTEKLKLGVLLVELFIQATGLVQVELRSARKGNQTHRLLQASPKLLSWLERQDARLELLNPMHMPMLVQPDDWTTPFDGGYLSKSDSRLTLVKTYNRHYLEELYNLDISYVYKAINGLQRTSWTINKPVLDVLEQLWEAGGLIAKLPSRDPLPLPPKPSDIADNEEARKEWKRQASKVYERNGRTLSKRVALKQKIDLARRFENEEEFYFVWQLDWRGRAYPIASAGLHPQGDDSGKGLLQFAEGKRIGDDGAWWLAVHIANLFGVDKVSFEDRVQWVRDNTPALLDSAANPLDGQRFWLDADKPFCALAACFEWAGYHSQGPDYISHLPIAMDGSCNGLQNFSALLRDSLGGKATNLIPTDKPQDIYKEVAKVVEDVVDKEAAKGDELAIMWQGRITRSLVKRPVMTLPYGATQVGMREQIIDHLKKCIEEGHSDELPSDEDGPVEDYYVAAHYIAGVIYKSIGQVVVAARQAMDWLQAAAKVAASDGLSIHWTAPSGLPILQRYTKPKTKTVAMYMGASRYRLKVSEQTDRINRRAMAQGISPNFVHSLDASHMMLTTSYCLENGIGSFAMIHDSYGTHAADSEAMYTLLRQAFVDIYSVDILREFRDQLVAQLPPELAKEIPPLPPKGDLELADVMDSEYFFA